jgi:hypothetical protein
VPDDPDSLCLACLHDAAFERRVAAEFIAQPNAYAFTLDTFPFDHVTVKLSEHDWVEFYFTQVPRTAPEFLANRVYRLARELKQAKKTA